MRGCSAPQTGPRSRPACLPSPTHPAPARSPLCLPPPQADFAPSAIDFLHRVGRTARAGKAGRVTSLYTPEAAPLVQAIRDNIAAGVQADREACREAGRGGRLGGGLGGRRQGCEQAAQQQRRRPVNCASGVMPRVCHPAHLVCPCVPVCAHVCACRPAGGGGIQPQALFPQEVQKVSEPLGVAPLLHRVRAGPLRANPLAPPWFTPGILRHT